MTELQRELCNLPNFLQIKMKWTTGHRQDAVDVAFAPLRRALPQLRTRDNEEELVRQAVRAAAEGEPVLQNTGPAPANSEAGEVGFRRVEFNSLRQAYDVPHEPDLRIREARVPDSLTRYIERVRLVEKLRASRVFLGFDRVKPGDKHGAAAAEHALEQVFRSCPSKTDERWLPGIETRGEGIYIEFKEEEIRRWLNQDDSRDFLRRRLPSAFYQRLNESRFLAPVSALTDEQRLDWTARYLLVHGFAHALINQFVFECGYSTAALRERLYVSSDSSAAMAGLLIYTAAGDSEGTLGGLVRLGRENRLGFTVAHALKRIAWCSADPVCSEVNAQGPDGSNKAACHACMLLPETSCETINRGLDRAILTGTPTEPDHGFFSELTRGLLV